MSLLYTGWRNWSTPSACIQWRQMKQKTREWLHRFIPISKFFVETDDRSLKHLIYTALRHEYWLQYLNCYIIHFNERWMRYNMTDIRYTALFKIHILMVENEILFCCWQHCSLNLPVSIFITVISVDDHTGRKMLYWILNIQNYYVVIDGLLIVPIYDISVTNGCKTRFYN